MRNRPPDGAVLRPAALSWQTCRDEEASVEKPDSKTKDPLAEGAHARAIGRPKDSCPYPADSAERSAWFEGYDGTPSDTGRDLLPNRDRSSPA